MTLVRWEPFRDLQSRINRMFDEPYGGPLSNEDAYRTVWAPPVDIYEKDANIMITVELPGLDPKDIKLSVEQNVLTISGERKAEKEEEGKTYHRRETYYGAFSRSFALPRLVDREKIEAEYKNGILTVTVPQTPEARPKQIDVRVA